MKKRIFILCLACLMAVSAAACGDSDEGGSKSKGSSSVSAESNTASDSSDETEPAEGEPETPAQPAPGGNFDKSVTYYAANSSRDTILEIKNSKFEVASTLNFERNVKGTISEDGKIVLDNGKELEYIIYDKYVKLYFTDEGDEFEFGTESELKEEMERVKYEVNKPKETEAATEAETEPEPETTTAPAYQYTDDDDDEGVVYDPDAYHIPLPRVDVSGDNWTQTPEGWLDDIKGTTNYKYYNRNKWSKYTGEGDPNFPDGDPAVEWAFLFADVNKGFGTLVKSSDSTPYTYEMLAEMLEYDVNPKYIDEEIRNRILELAPGYGSTGATFYSKEIKSDSTNDLDKYIINFTVSVEDDNYDTHHYSGSFKARDIANTSTDKYSYSYSDSKMEMYWTVYPYTFVGKAIINIRIVDKATNTTYDRILWEN